MSTVLTIVRGRKTKTERKPELHSVTKRRDNDTDTDTDNLMSLRCLSELHAAHAALASQLSGTQSILTLDRRRAVAIISSAGLSFLHNKKEKALPRYQK